MKEIASIAAESIAREKTRHLVNGVATGTAGTITATGSIAGSVMEWLPVVGVLGGICVSAALFYKTYLEIKLTKIELAKEGRRNSDQ